MPDPRPPHAAPEEVTGKLHDLLATLWSRSRETISERLDVLRTTHRILRTNPADKNARRAGADAAHKLAGILGTFGLPDGTNLARHAEIMLESGAPIRPFELDALQRAIDQLHLMIEAKSRDTGKRRV
ncbi:MAG TPA: Hpt domain-containing protein [Acidobacteriaceae bacterium]|jgi:HPt (histidine-containing phosphotransfer) domain-containing protein|nr:Hpt domain-containing protein [Acidobacteriaceae bacterium]